MELERVMALAPYAPNPRKADCEEPAPEGDVFLRGKMEMETSRSQTLKYVRTCRMLGIF